MVITVLLGLAAFLVGILVGAWAAITFTKKEIKTSE